MKYIMDHPILGEAHDERITMTFDGRLIKGYTGQTVAALLTANGVRAFRHTAKSGETRGLYCGIGQCTDCIMIIDGRPNTRACVTMARDGMTVETQYGTGIRGGCDGTV